MTWFLTNHQFALLSRLSIEVYIGHWCGLCFRKRRRSILKSACRLRNIDDDIFSKHGWRFSNRLCYWFCYFPSMREAWVLCFVLFCVWCYYCVEDRVHPTIENNVIITVAYITRWRRPVTFSFARWNKNSLHEKTISTCLVAFESQQWPSHFQQRMCIIYMP
jgi:hypothetical protein